MKVFISLTKLNLNLNFGLSALKYRFTKEKKKRWEPILALLGVIVGFVPLLVFYTILMNSIFSIGLSLNQPELVLVMAFLSGQILVFIFGIFYIMSTFYFSKDLYALIPLPLKPYQVLGSKIVVVMVNEYLTLLPILLPPIIIFGTRTGQGLLYWIKALLLILASPVLPLVLDALLIIVLMRFINFKKSKDLLAVVVGFLGIFIGLGTNFISTRIPKGNEQEYLRNIITSQSGIIKMISQKFPPSLWATLGLSRQGLIGAGYLALFIVVSIFLFLVLMWLGNKIFYKSVLAGQEVARKKKVLSAEEANDRYGKVSTPVLAILRREWMLLIRTPVYFLNGLVGIIIGPFLLVFMFFTGGQSSELEQLLFVLQNEGLSVYVTLGGLALALFTAGMNVAASTAVSREGQTFWIAKMIPVSPKQQVMGKYINVFSVSEIGVLVTAILLAVFLKLSIAKSLVIIILGTLGSILLSALNLLVDVLRPKLVWNNPQEAMKQNMNSLLGMLVSMLVLCIMAGITVLLLTNGASEWLTYIVLGAVMCITSVLSLKGLFAVAERQYRKIEV
jgi:ABC-2 type transport system permease protein